MGQDQSLVHWMVNACTRAHVNERTHERMKESMHPQQKDVRRTQGGGVVVLLLLPSGSGRGQSREAEQAVSGVCLCVCVYVCACVFSRGEDKGTWAGSFS